MAEPHYSIRMVAQRTGLTPHVIRIWERRYGAVQPLRTGTNRRVYSDEEIERLQLLRTVTESGHSIRNVASLPLDSLRLLAAETAETGQTRGQPTAGGQRSANHVEECVAAVKALDSKGLEEALARAAVALGSQGVLQRTIAPMAELIGTLWRKGEITAAHEHFASAVVRTFLGNAAGSFAGANSAPALVVATPAGQLHELGALLAGAAAANVGWTVNYLGPSLPAAEIAGAAIQKRARAVALSIVYPEDDPRLEGELRRLRELLPTYVTLLVGGRAMPAYRETLREIGARPVSDLSDLCEALEDLRKPTRKEK